MIVRIDQPEPQLVLRLENFGNGERVLLLASIAGSDDEQEVLRFEIGGVPTDSDPLGQKKDTLHIYTRKLRAGFPIEIDAHGHAVVRMKA